MPIDTAQPFNYVALGDSTGVGFGAPPGTGYVDRIGARLQQRYPRARRKNLAANGATARDVLDHQIPAVRGEGAGLVTLFVGGNDVWRGTSVASFGTVIERIGDALATSGATVVVATLPDLSHAPAAGMIEQFTGIARSALAARIRLLNTVIDGAARRRGFILVDLFEETAHSLPTHPEFFGPDGFHPSASGHQALAEAIWPAIERAVNASS